MSAGWRTPNHSAERPASISFFGLFGAGNTGNDGSLEAMLEFVRRVRPDAELMCICGQPEYVERMFGVRAAPIYANGPSNPVLRKGAYLLQAMRELRGCSLLIVPGTGILDDFGTGPTGFPLALWTWCFAARLQRLPIAFVSIGAGPIHHRLSRRLMKSAIGMSFYRSYRDQLSRDFMAGIGFDVQNDAVYPDLAFSLPTPPATRQCVSGPGPVEVGLGVMTYQGWRNDEVQGAEIYAAYLGKMTEFALWLLEGGHRVRLLMGDGTDERAMADLQRAVRLRLPSLEAGRFRAEPSRTLHELMHQIAQTDLVVATRFHNVVCALKLARPTLSVGYAMKNDVLMRDVGLGRFCQSIEAFDVVLLKRQFVELLSDSEKWHRRIAATIRRYRDSLVHQEAVLERHLHGRRLECAAPASHTGIVGLRP